MDFRPLPLPTCKATPEREALKGSFLHFFRTVRYAPIGRAPVIFDRAQVVERRAAGESWRDVARALKVGVGTVRRAYHSVPKPHPASVRPMVHLKGLRAHDRVCQNHRQAAVLHDPDHSLAHQRRGIVF